MGTGKTTLGRLLADRLGWEFRDLDSAIEDDEEASVVKIFAEKGEAYFRRTEREALARLAALAGPAVIACGGGSFCDAENQTLMHSLGVSVWLDQPFEQIWGRRDDLAAARPLFKDSDEAGLHVLHDRRAEWYRRATFHLPIREKGIGQALEELTKILGTTRI